MLDSISTSNDFYRPQAEDLPMEEEENYSLSSIDRELIVLTQEGLPLAHDLIMCWV